MSICQLHFRVKKIILSLLLVSATFGCATKQSNDVVVDERVIRPSWLKLPLRFADRDKDDNFLAHPFFDVEPAYYKEDSVFNIRFVVTTPVESPFQYELDLYSGKLYRSREYCAQDDVWEFYKGHIEKPNFTQGIVPRIFDQTNSPQRVIILSGKDQVQPFKLLPTHYDEARIIGSMVMDTCESFPCDRPEKWTPTQILVGVVAADPKMAHIKSFMDLKSKVDWSYTKAMLTNMFGTYSVGGKIYPAYRITKELNAKDTKAHFDKNATIVNVKKMEEWRMDCLRLYDSMWSEAQKIRAMKNGQSDAFLKYFKDFYAKNSQNFYGCQKLVRPANINEDYRRLWFFTYIQAFTLLEKNGFFYNCHNNAWAFNPKVDCEKYFNNQNSELARCRSKDFEKSFDQAINGMSLMKAQTNRHFRFVEYDNGKGGSHQKIYGWIQGKTTHHACVGKAQGPQSVSFDIFPQDVTWESFKVDGDRTVR